MIVLDAVAIIFLLFSSKLLVDFLIVIVYRVIRLDCSFSYDLKIRGIRVISFQYSFLCKLGHI